MSYIGIATILTIAFIGGLLNEVAIMSTAGNRDASLQNQSQLVSSQSILTISDSEQNQNPTNAQVSTPGATDRDWWDYFLDSVSWNFVYLSGDLQIIRHVMWVLTAALFAWFALSLGTGLVGAIRNAPVP